MLPDQFAPDPELSPGVAAAGMREAVEADIEAMGALQSKSARSLTKLALWLADSIDARGANMSPANVARVAQELRSTLGALTSERANDTDRLAEYLTRLSTPVRHEPDGGPPVDGSAGDGGRGGAR